MSKLTAVIAIASGSSDVDVIVTASLLRRARMSIVIASAEGWSPVTLRNGLVIKPTCSLDRLFYSKSDRPFDLLLLPDGDDISYGRLRSHPKLSTTIKLLLSESQSNSKPNCKIGVPGCGRITPCIIFSGICVKLHQDWVLRNKKSLREMMRGWFLSKARGSHIIVQENGLFADAVLCSPSDQHNVVETAELCMSLGQALVRIHAQNEERERIGNLKFSAIQAWRKHSMRAPPSHELKFLTFLRDCAWLPTSVRTFILSPICHLLSNDTVASYHPAQLFSGLQMEGCVEASKEVYFDQTALQMVSKSMTYITGTIMRLVSDSLDLNRRSKDGILIQTPRLERRTAWTFKIRRLQLRDSAQYICRGWNSEDQITFIYEVQVTEIMLGLHIN